MSTLTARFQLLFHTDELERSGRKKRPLEFLSARLAAKRALAQLVARFSQEDFNQICIRNLPSGQPVVECGPELGERCPVLATALVSLSHTPAMGGALVLIDG